MKEIVLLLLLSVALPFVVVAKEKKADEIDYLSLAAVLIRDGFFDRAEQALSNLNEADETVDTLRLYTLGGIVSFQKQQYPKAIDKFTNAVHIDGNASNLYIYIARANYSLKKYKETITALHNAKELGTSKAGFISMRASSFWKLKKINETWKSLFLGHSLFPNDVALMRQHFIYAVELGLFQEALHYGEQFLNAGKQEVDDYLALGTALRKSKAYKKALHFLELAKLKFPTNEKVILSLAHVYLDMNKIGTAAALFEDASRLENQYSSQASELFRKAKRLYHALYLNAQIKDQKEKLKQRLGLFLEFGDFESAAAMGAAMSRNGLLEDESLRYALAYALYEDGQFDASEKHLALLTKSELFKKATYLRKSMSECRADVSKCN
jgi:tetratricopeptide (TPR) repeat protein